MSSSTSVVRLCLFAAALPACSAPFDGPEFSQRGQALTQAAGWFDRVTDDVIEGWLCNPQSAALPLNVHLYASNLETAKYDPAGGPLVNDGSSYCFTWNNERVCHVASAVADVAREKEVADLCGGNGNHGFRIATPYRLKRGGIHRVYAFAVDAEVSGSPTLPASPIEYALHRSGTPAGFDYGLTRRCVRGVDASQANYFKDETDCIADAPRNWTVAIQSEKSLGVECSGRPPAQSLPIFPVGGGALQLGVSGAPGERSFELKHDAYAYAHPCGDHVFNWFVVMDHAGHGGGPLPPVERLGVRLQGWYNDWLPVGASRFMVGCEARWGGKVHGVEVSMVLSNWGDRAPQDAEVVNADQLSDGEFVHLDGRAIGFAVNKNQWQDITLHCGALFRHLVARGLFTAPPDGDFGSGASMSVFAGHEFMNGAVQNAGVAHTKLKAIKIEELAD